MGRTMGRCDYGTDMALCCRTLRVQGAAHPPTMHLMRLCCAVMASCVTLLSAVLCCACQQ